MQIISSRQNERVQRLRRLARESKFRREQGEYVCEGFKLYQEAELYGRITAVYTAESVRDKIAEGANVFVLPDELFAYISTQEASQGVLFTCERKALTAPDRLSGRMLLLDGVSDPGNMGTIIRTAEALGISGMILCGGCVDIYNPKVVRAAMGSLFRLPVFETEYARLPALLADSGAGLYRAHAREGASDLWGIAFSDNAVVAVGSEANGLSSEILALGATDIQIPMRGRAESLNAAAAASILMWEMTRG